jgi:hypothetical protein
MKIQSYGENIYTQLGWQGKTLTWCPSDSEKRFNNNISDPEKKKQMEELGWDRKSVSYTFNKHGFRADEFTGGEGDSIVFLGCSLTMGIGMTLENTWAYKVAHSLGLRRYNLGVGGGGPDMCFRLAYHWIPKLKPKYVVMLTPERSRIELIWGKSGNQTIQYMPNVKTDDAFYHRWLEYSANADMNLLKCLLGVQSICDQAGVPLIETYVHDYLEQHLSSTDGPARDLMHPGRTWNTVVAKSFLEKIAALGA